MEYQALNNSINRGVLATVYLFHGTEDFLMERYLDKLKAIILPQGLEDFNFDRVDGEKVTPERVVELASMMPVMAEKRLIIIDNPVYLLANKTKEDKYEDKPLLEYLQNPNPSSCVVFKLIGSPDKRKKLFKAIAEKGQVYEFAPLKGRHLEEWIISFLQEKGKKIQPEALTYLSIIGSNGLNFLEKELEKLLIYSGDEPIISLETVQNVVTKTIEVNVFDLIDSVANKEVERAWDLLHTTLASGEAPMKLIYLLVRQFRLILIAKDLLNQGCTEKQIKEKMDVHPYVVKKALAQGRKFSERELVNALEKLLETEILLKSGGGDPEKLLENFIVGVCVS